MKIIQCETYEQASEQVYHLLLRRLKDKPDAVLGLPTGSTPLGLYRYMADGFAAGDFNYNRVTTFNIDEYAGLDKTDPNSYYRFMEDNLFSRINIPAQQRNIPSGLGSLEDNCAAYDELIAAAGGIDIQVLAVGANGHIGFNEPGTPFESTTHIVELAEKTRADNARFFSSPADVPLQAITMGIKLMMNAREIIFIGTGAEKASAMKEMISGSVTTACPASVLQLHPNITVFLDRAAGAGLD